MQTEKTWQLEISLVRLEQGRVYITVINLFKYFYFSLLEKLIIVKKCRDGQKIQFCKNVRKKILERKRKETQDKIYGVKVRQWFVS